jgi:hypothetical protein
MVRIIPDCGVLCKFFFTSTYSNFTFFYYQNSVERAAPVNPHRRAQPIKKETVGCRLFLPFQTAFFLQTRGRLKCLVSG